MTCTLPLPDRPGTPSALVIKDLQRESVTLEWKPPVDDGGVEIGYTIEKLDVSKQLWTQVRLAYRTCHRHIAP